MDMQDAADLPVVALAIGDPAGISPELAARLLANAEVLGAADLVVFGDARVLDRGAEIAGVEIVYDVVRSVEQVEPGRKPVLVDLGQLDPATITLGEASAEGGRFALANYAAALSFGQ